MTRCLFLIATAVTFCVVTATVIKSDQFFDDVPEKNGGLNVIQPYIKEGELNETLVKLSNLLKDYDPYLIQEADYKINGEKFRAELVAKNIYFSGFSNFVATQLRNTVTLFPLGVKSTFKLKFEELQLMVPDYFFDGLAVFVPFYGKGFVNLTIHEIYVGGYAFIRRKSSRPLLKELELNFNILHTNLTVSGLLNNEPLSQIVSTATTECFSKFVNLYNVRLGKLLGARLVDPINKILNPPKAKDKLEESENIERNDLGGISSRANEKESFDIGPYKLKSKIVV